MGLHVIGVSSQLRYMRFGNAVRRVFHKGTSASSQIATRLHKKLQTIENKHAIRTHSKY